MPLLNSLIDPLTFDKLMCRCLSPEEEGLPLAVAVSGGADSLCLTILLNQWAKKRGAPLFALTVDHHLRPESTVEALQVAEWMGQMGISHSILNWQSPKPTSRIQERARQERYRLLTAWCVEHNIKFLALGHHALDQAETILMRLSRKSGLHGLSGMNTRVVRNQVHLIRPLLPCNPLSVKKTLKVFRQDYLKDPTNGNLQYERTRWRLLFHMMPDDLMQAVLSVGEFAYHQVYDKNRLFFQEARLTIKVYPGFFKLPLQWLWHQRAEHQMEVVRHLLQTMSGKPFPPSARLVQFLVRALKDGRRCATGHGCIAVQSKGELFVAREKRSIQKQCLVPAKSLVVWEKRWTIRNHMSVPIYIEALGAYQPKLPLKCDWSVPSLIKQSLPAAVTIDGDVICTALHPKHSAIDFHFISPEIFDSV